MKVSDLRSMLCREAALNSQHGRRSVPPNLASIHVQKGDAVAVLGKPFGYAGAVGFGTIANSRNELDADDGSYQLLCTDIGAAEDGTGVIVNLSGEVVGIIDQSISDNSSKRLVTGYGISGLKSEIELLSNGQAVPYVGIRGLDVTAEIEAQEFQMEYTSRQ